jgi:hypothetical protein
MPSWVRRVLVLPAAVLGITGAQLLWMIAIMLWNPPAEVAFNQLVNNVVAPLFFIRAGVFAAPRQKLRVAVVLAGLWTLLMLWMVWYVLSIPGATLSSTVVWPMPAGLDEQRDPVWWVVVLAVIGATTSLLTCLWMYQHEKRRPPPLYSLQRPPGGGP